MADEQRLRLVEEHIEELATAVLGRRRSILEGGGRAEREGLVSKVDRLNSKVDTAIGNQQRNRLTRREKMTLAGAVIAGFFTLAAAIASGLLS